jgi:hypothetical protein
MARPIRNQDTTDLPPLITRREVRSEVRGGRALENPIGTELRTAAGDMGRREFIKSSAAAFVVIGTGDYTKPVLRSLGVARGQSLISPVPPSGFTPGFWGNSGSVGAAGNDMWDTPSDPQWPTGSTNPFVHDTLFNDFFEDHSALNGMTMWQVVSGGGASVAAQKAARQLVAAYLNATLNATYPFTPAGLHTMWSNAIAGGNASLLALQSILDAANNNN